MNGIEFAKDDLGTSRFGITGIVQMQQQFIEQHPFVLSKRKNEKLYCDNCAKEFPAYVSFFIVAKNSTRELFCHPCNNKRLGIDPHEEIKKLLLEKQQEQIQKKEPAQMKLF